MEFNNARFGAWEDNSVLNRIIRQRSKLRKEKLGLEYIGFVPIEHH